MVTSSDGQRPDPDALLADIGREQCGGLKVFLGAAPGVGKTCAMLLAAQEAFKEGKDLVIGVVESHGRRETEAFAEGLEQVPLQGVGFHGRTFQELDLDAVIERRPAVVLVDELAHRNVPGTRHPRRYQDIEELVHSGIEVWTTLNVQHLDSLNDRIARISGVRMHETVPDKLLETAKDVVLVDLAPQELIDRLQRGKVYVPDQVRPAQEGFFNPTNLSALREMAFVAAANRADADLHGSMQRYGKLGPWPARERLVIAVDGQDNSEQVVRAGKRLAARWRAPWTVVHVDTGRLYSEHERGRLEEVLQLTERLGGERALLRGSQVATEIINYARRKNATTLVIGRTRERPMAGLFHQSLTQKLLRCNKDFELTVIGAEPGRQGDLRKRWDAWLEMLRGTHFRHLMFAASALLLSVLVSVGLEHLLPLPIPTLSLVFLVGVLVVAARTTLPSAFATALVGSLLFNFFFTEPRFTLSVYRTGELITVFFFLVVALIGSNMASRLRAQLVALRATNQQSQLLLNLSKKLAASAGPMAIQTAAVELIAESQQMPTCLLMDNEGGGLRPVAVVPGNTRLDDKARAAADWAFQHHQTSGWMSKTLASVRWRFIPLQLDSDCHGVLGVHLGALGGRASSEQLLMLDALANQVTLSLARTRLSSNLEQARVAEETERLRSALLSSVSHDLRTPLASMIGSASTLRDLGERLSQEDKQDLLDAVLGEGRRLNRYIENLLDMTRLGHGTLKLHRDWVTLTDILGSALRRLKDVLAGVHLVRDIAGDIPLLYVHPALIEQALVNVIENAARFSPIKGTITITACLQQDQLLITVTDQGPGIPDSEIDKVFDMFFTGESGDTDCHGTGLGLAICHGMIGAHGGSIKAMRGPDGTGTSIVIRLPVKEQPGTTDDGLMDEHGQ